MPFAAPLDVAASSPSTALASLGAASPSSFCALPVAETVGAEVAEPLNDLEAEFVSNPIVGS